MNQVLKPNPDKTTYLVAGAAAAVVLAIIVWPKKAKADSKTTTPPSQETTIVKALPGDPGKPAAPAENPSATNKVCKTFEELAPYAPVAKFNIYYVDTHPVDDQWPAAKAEFIADPRAAAYSSAACSFYYWENNSGRWMPDVIANAHAKSWFAGGGNVSG